MMLLQLGDIWNKFSSKSIENTIVERNFYKSTIIDTVWWSKMIAQQVETSEIQETAQQINNEQIYIYIIFFQMKSISPNCIENRMEPPIILSV